MKQFEQNSWPARLLFIERETGRRYTADCVAIGELPDLERDSGACCYLDDFAHPRYIVDGREQPDFSPAIPPDLLANGWTWIGGWLTHYNVPPPAGVGLCIGMPHASLDEIWSAARKCDAARIAYQAAVAEAEQKRAAAPARKPKQKKPERSHTPPKEHKVEPVQSTPTVVGRRKDTKPVADQLTMW
jgi:hypothetical protein